MEQCGWILTLGMNTLKMVLFLFGILGFEVNKGKWKYVSFLYVILGIPMILQFLAEAYWYVSIWKMLFIFIQETPERKIQCYFLQMIAITIVDLAVVGVYVNIFFVI